jgi:hypothetical protein
MSGDNHTAERDGDAVSFIVRPESAFFFYFYDWLLWVALLTPILMGFVMKGMTDADIYASAALAAPLAVLLILLMPGNRYRRRFDFAVRRNAVVIQPASPADGINYAMLFGIAAKEKSVPRTQIREVVVRNSIMGRWSHSLALGDLNTPNMAYVGVGAGGIAAVMGMRFSEPLVRRSPCSAYMVGSMFVVFVLGVHGGFAPCQVRERSGVIFAPGQSERRAVVPHMACLPPYCSCLLSGYHGTVSAPTRKRL